MKYIKLRVRSGLVMHGYTLDNKEVIEESRDQEFVDKLIALERIQSATERYLLVSSSHGRALYWEYEGGLASLTSRLATAGLVVE